MGLSIFAKVGFQTTLPNLFETIRQEKTYRKITVIIVVIDWSKIVISNIVLPFLHKQIYR
jgi:hypothetical protein